MNTFNKNESVSGGQPAQTDHSTSRRRTILVPISLSQRSHEALPLALRLARETGGQIVLLRAVELLIVGEERGVERGRVLQELMAAADSSLMGLGRSVCEDVPFSVIVREGPPDEVILRTAQTLGVDAIVMGPRHPGIFQWMCRNNVQSVLRRAKCPVYIAAPKGVVSSAAPEHRRAAEPIGKEAGNPLHGRQIVPQAGLQPSWP